MKLTLRFRRTSKGSLYAASRGYGLSVYQSNPGNYQWRIRDSQGNERFSERGFSSEQLALDDLEDALVEEIAIQEMLKEDDDDV